MMLDKDEYDEIKDVTRYESELINRRLTWLLASQTLLFAGIGAAAAGPNAKVFEVLFIAGSSLGLVSSLGLLTGIGAAVWEIHRAYKRIETKQGGLAVTREARLLIMRRAESPWTMFFGEGAALVLPVAFVIAWGVLLWYSKSVVKEIPAYLPALVLSPIVVSIVITLMITPGLGAHLRDKLWGIETLLIEVPRDRHEAIQMRSNGFELTMKEYALYAIEQHAEQAIAEMKLDRPTIEGPWHQKRIAIDIPPDQAAAIRKKAAGFKSLREFVLRCIDMEMKAAKPTHESVPR